MKLWKKNYDVNKEIEQFTVGDDYLLDQKLVKYDCVASIAHAKMLKKIRILKDAELKKLIEGLDEIIKLSKDGKFKIDLGDEDCHTAIENFLVKKYGDVGKKIHTGRSRNDQVLTALRLFEKDELKEILDLIDSTIDSINKQIKSSRDVALPGYTHMQRAMPTTIKKLFGAYTDALTDDKEIVGSVLNIINKSPLGSAAGFGVPVINIDRGMTAKELKFGSIQSEMYSQNSRGKYDALILNGVVQIMMDLNKIATDLILFSMVEFGYFSLPKEFCTGSSIMPQKKNPDILELVRGKYSIVLGYEAQIKNIYSSIISGYYREMQLTKEPLIKSFDVVKDCLKIISLVFDGVKVNKDNCKKALSSELYATEEAYKLVKKGKTFRDAYRQIGGKYK